MCQEVSKKGKKTGAKPTLFSCCFEEGPKEGGGGRVTSFRTELRLGEGKGAPNVNPI